SHLCFTLQPTTAERNDIHLSPISITLLTRITCRLLPYLQHWQTIVISQQQPQLGSEPVAVNMSSPPVTLQLVWDDKERKFVLQIPQQGDSLALPAHSESLSLSPPPPPSSSSSPPAASAPASMILFDLDTLKQKAEEAKQHIQVHQVISQQNRYLNEIKLLRWPPSPAQEKTLFDLQSGIKRQDPIQICLSSRNHKPWPKNQRSTEMNKEERDENKAEGYRNKDQPFLAISTAGE
ncbi:hypothetical protein F5883DRAFT_676351, partial [Diaporthe sp. PMI_573]